MKGFFIIIVLVVAAFHIIIPNIASAANVMWLKFDEGSGTTAADSSGYGNGGVINGATWTSGRFGGALHFETGTYVVVSHSPSLSLANGFTAEAWVKAASSGTDTRWIFSKGYPNIANHEGFMIQLWDDNQCYSYVTVDDYFYAALISYPFPHDSQFHHVAQTVEQSGASVIHKLYLDGLKVGERTVTGTITDSNLGMAIGGNNFVGEIDEARMHDRALSPYEIFEYVHSDSVSYFNIENSKVRMRIASSGFIESLYDKQNSRELLNPSHQRFFQYSVGEPGNFHYFTNVSMAGNDLRLLDVIGNVNIVLTVDTDDDYIMFTVKSLSVPPSLLNFASLVLKLRTNLLQEIYGSGWDFAYKNYIGDQNFTLISVPLSPNAYSEMERDTTTRSLVAGFRPYPAINSMPGSRAMLITLPASVASFEREDILLRIKNRLNKRQSTLPDVYYSTLFTWFSEPETDAVRDFANSSGFKNILIGAGGGWNIGDGFWDVNLARFPNGINSLKAAVDRLHAGGLKVGLHMLPTLLHPNNPLVLSDPQDSILRYPNGTPYHPTGVYAPLSGFYVVNFRNDSVMDYVASRYANVINQIGVDMVYFDGSEIVGTEAVGQENVDYHINRYLEILLSKIRNNITVQIVWNTLYSGPMHTKRQALADGIDYFRNNSIKDWIDQAIVQWIIYYRYRLLNPELGWIWYHVTKDVSEYEYALSASIALGTPLVLEGDWQNTFVPAFSSPNYAAFESALDKYLSVFNRYAGRTVLKESLNFYPSHTANYVFTQYESGLAGFFVNGSTDLPAGGNRDVWIHVTQNKNVLVNLRFTGLEKSRRHVLERNGVRSSVFSDSEGKVTAALNLGSSPPYNLLRLYMSADLNNDGAVDIQDLLNVTSHFGMTSGFSRDLDVVSDNEINIYDLVFVAGRFT